MTSTVTCATAGMLLWSLAGCSRSEAQKPLGAIGDNLLASTFATGFEHPWGIAFLPDGRALVTERPGRMRLVGRDGSVSPALAGVPQVVASGQGGLLGLVLDPRFAENGLVYIAYSEAGEGGVGTAVAKARLAGNALEDVRVIYRQVPKVSGGSHFGSRLVFARDGTLFITLGDRQGYREKAQDLSTTLGKVVRINTDGSVPADNPFVGRNGVRPEIWSSGHRNPQGATLHPGTGQLWTVEHGARGGDELNHPEAGRNYGWPVIAYGVDYSGARLGEGTTKEGMEQPAFFWDPSIGPAGLIYYTGDLIPAWKGRFVTGALALHGISVLTPSGGGFTERRYLDGIDRRIRDVAQGPDGAVYLLVDDGKGEIVRVGGAP